MFKRLKTWWKEKQIKKNQKTFIWCDCGNELCSSNSFVSDTYEEDGNHVRYKCSRCGLEQDYDFDMAPVPIKRPIKRFIIRS